MGVRWIRQLGNGLITVTCHSLQILTWIPYSWQMRIGKQLGYAMYYLSKRSRMVATKNIQLCFPSRTADEQHQLVKNCFASIGMGFFEGLLATYGSKKLFARLTHQITGLDAVYETLRAQQGVIILFPHFIPMYLIGRLTLEATNLPFSLMYNAPKNKALNRFFLHHLKKYCSKIFNRRQVKGLIDHVRQGNLVWYAPDLDIGRKRSLFIPFFNVPTATLTATVRIAELSQAKVFPIEFFRRDDYSGYDIHIMPPLEHFPSDDLYSDLLQINQTIERSINIRPEQYLWIYKRFSTRPPGQKKYY